MSLSPCLLMVAPNGARRVYHDHPAIPLTPEDLQETHKSAWQRAPPPCMCMYVKPTGVIYWMLVPTEMPLAPLRKP